jgi:hypothetical protein
MKETLEGKKLIRTFQFGTIIVKCEGFGKGDT